MVILTSSTFDSFKAAIHSSPENGCRPLYRASCTSGPEHAAKAVVRKNFGDAAAETVRQVTDKREIYALTGDHFKDPKRKQVFDVWTFDQKAKSAAPAMSKITTPTLPLEIQETSPAQTPSAKPSGPPPSVSKSSVLSACSSALLKLRDIIVRHEDKFAALTLGPRLQMGLQCLKAYQVFVHNPGKGGRPKKTVTRDGIPNEGFEGWLKTENEWLKRPTAYKYMEAVHGLGLDHTATEKQLAAALKTLLRKEKTVTLKSLIDRAPARLGAAEPEPQEPQQTEFEFIRSNLSAFREEANTLIAIAPRLRQIPEAHRAACSRAYHLLRELTGSDWSPSETPDPLSTVDPDTITI